MGEKKIIIHQQVAETLKRIEEATWGEEMERRRLGLPPEPEKVPGPRGRKIDYLRTRERKKGRSTLGFVEEWQNENRDYTFRNDDVNEAEIINETDVKFSVEFVDYLISNARKALKEKNLDILGEIQIIKIRYIVESRGIITVAVRDKADNVAILDFNSVPPFDLKKINSTMGINTF